MRVLLTTICLLIYVIPLLAVGTKDIDVNNKGIALSFHKLEGRYNYFMRYGCKEEERLYISLNKDEKLYFGFQIQTANAPDKPILLPTGSWIRIRDKNDNIVYGPQQIIQNQQGYIRNRLEADNGPSQLVAGGYNALEFIAPNTGDFYMEIAYNPTDGNVDVFSDAYFLASLYDWTILGTDNRIKKGRVWSKAWHILTLNGFTDDGALYAKQYIYTDDGIISRLDYNGVIPWQYILISNSTGVGATGDAISDRQSIDSEFGDELLPQYKLFFDEPDTNVFKLADVDLLFGNLNKEIDVTGCPGNYCINVDVNRDANAQLLINMNGVDGYQENTSDVFFDVELKKGENCVKWDGKDGLGKNIKTAEIKVDIAFVAGITHMPMFDVEYNENGFHVEFIYPKSIAKEAEIYWDDSQINGKEEVQIGCKNACHDWSEYNYGNERIINSWWYITKDPISSEVKVDTYTLKIEENKTICEGDEIILLGPTNMQSYTWTPVQDIKNETQQNAIVAPKTTTEYKLTVTDNQGCEYKDSLVVSVNNIPSINTIAIPNKLCLGDISDLKAEGAVNYTWNNGLGIGANQKVTPILGKTVYEVIGIDANGCEGKGIVEVNVYSLPKITVSDEEICLNNEVELSVSGGVSYLWKNTITGLSAINISNPKASPTTTTTYTVEVTDVNSCVSEKDLQVIVNPLPVIKTNDRQMCEGKSVVLSAGGGKSYLWKNITTGLDKINTSSPTASPTTTTTYTVEVTTDKGCVADQDVTVTVHPLPKPTIVNPKTIVCPGETVIYEGKGFSSSVFVWKPLPDEAFTSSIYSTKNDQTFAQLTFGEEVQGTVKIELREITNKQCEATTNVDILMDDLVDINFNLIDGVCVDANPISLNMATAITNTTGTGTYYLNGTSITELNPTTLPQETPLNVVYEFITTQGCSYKEEETITVHKLPVINFPPLNTVCSNDAAIVLNATPLNGVYSGVGVKDGIFTPNSSEIVFEAPTNILYTYTDANGCVNSEISTITVQGEPDILIKDDIIICKGLEGTLEAQTIASDVTYQWYKDGEKINGAVNSSLLTSEEGEYQVQIDQTVCTNISDTKFVKVVTLENEAGLPQIILYGESAILSGDVDVVNITQKHESKWKVYDTEQIVGNQLQTLVQPETTTTYIVITQDQYGCEAMDTVSIVVLDPIVIPNGFSPNGDGKNETWIVANINDYPNAHVRVYNRWGNIVYEDYGYLNDWNGTDDDGSPLPVATYYYVIELNYRDLEYAGSVTIVR